MPVIAPPLPEEEVVDVTKAIRGGCGAKSSDGADEGGAPPPPALSKRVVAVAWDDELYVLSLALAIEEERVTKPRLCGFPDDSSCDTARPLLSFWVWLLL